MNKIFQNTLSLNLILHYTIHSLSLKHVIRSFLIILLYYLKLFFSLCFSSFETLDASSRILQQAFKDTTFALRCSPLKLHRYCNDGCAYCSFMSYIHFHREDTLSVAAFRCLEKFFFYKYFKVFN